jgi:hypothetical protein
MYDIKLRMVGYSLIVYVCSVNLLSLVVSYKLFLIIFLCNSSPKYSIILW